MNKIRIISLNKKIRLGLLIILPILAAVAICFLFLTINKKYIDQKYKAYTYSDNAKINYNVSLLPNILYTQKNLPEGGIYITDLVASINPRMIYEFSGDQIAKIQGRYSITALYEMFIKDGKDEDKALLQRKTVIQPEKSFSVNDKNVMVTSGCNLNLKSYNDMVKNTSDLYKLNCTAKLTILWKVDVDVKTGSGPVKETIESSMEIPINEKYFEVGGNLNNNKDGQIMLTRKILAPHYNEKITAACVTAVLCILTLFFIMMFTTVLPDIDAIEKKTKQIFRDYAGRLASITDDIVSKHKETVNVATIEDLARIADDLGRPILYKINQKNEEIVDYLVLDDNAIYMLDIRKSLSCITLRDAKQASQFTNKPSLEE